MEKNEGAINALTSVTTRENGASCRTALQLTKSEVSSIDVLSPSGDLMCRLNIASNEDLDWGNIDVILFPDDTPKEKRKVGTVKAWVNGAPVLNRRLPQCSLIAVDIQGPKEKK